MVKAIIFLYEPDLSSLTDCQTPGPEPPPRSLSLTVERVKPIWLKHLTIFIFIAQSDKLIWDHSHQLTEERPPNQTKFAKLIWTLAKNKSDWPFYQPLRRGRAGLGVKFISLIKLKLRVRTGPWKLYMPTQQNYLQVWLTDWSSSYYRMWPYLLISILVIATFANLFSLKNFNWLSECL